MEDRRKSQEQLLEAWMAMEVCIRGNRLLSEFSMNEMLVCNTLYHQMQTGGEPVTATDLCQKLQLLKSQMNRLLSGMEYDGLIRRERNPADKRESYVYLREEALPRYLKEHDHVLNIVGAVCSALGQEDTTALTTLMRKAAHIVNHMKEEN